MKNDLKKVRLSGQNVHLYIFKWDAKDTQKGLGIQYKELVKTSVVERVVDQIAGKDSPKDMEFFLNNFINKEKGVILCVNTPVLMSKFFTPEPIINKPEPDNRTDDEKIADAKQYAAKKKKWDESEKLNQYVRFTKVFMPEEFKNNSHLTSEYVFGEKLLVAASFEVDRVKAAKARADIQAGATTSPSAINKGNKTLVLYYTDTNSKGRSTKGKSGGAATWS